MQIEVKSYKVGWSPKTKQGSARVILADGNEHSVPISSPEELSAIILILQEKPIYLDPDNGYLLTKDWEPVGEHDL